MYHVRLAVGSFILGLLSLVAVGMGALFLKAYYNVFKFFWGLI